MHQDTSLTTLAADSRAFRRLPELAGAPQAFRIALKIIARNWWAGSLTFVLPSGRELHLQGASPGPDARLSVLEIRWGLIPDMGGSQVLPRLVRLDVAKELTFTVRLVSGTEALRLGLATRLTATPLDVARARGQAIGGKSASAFRAG